jgi:hypothetical protein
MKLATHIALGALLIPLPAAPAAEKRNSVFMLADDPAYGDRSCFGGRGKGTG